MSSQTRNRNHPLPVLAPGTWPTAPHLRGTTFQTPLGETCCFTGHRPKKLGGYDESSPIIANIKLRLRDEIIKADRAGYNNFITGMALGVDMWAAELVLEMMGGLSDGVTLTAALPFYEQCSRWPETSRIRWGRILEQCDQVVEVCEPGYAPWKLQKRNVWMVDRSSLVIAVWDNSDGGTANCVRYAQKKNRKIVQITPNSHRI